MMILIYVLISAVIFYSVAMIKKPVLRISMTTIGLLLLVGAVGLTTLNFNQHWGMKEVTTTQTRAIYSAAPAQSPVKMVIKKELGTKADNYVLVYRDHADDQEAKAHFIPDKDDMNKLVHSSATYRVADVDEATVTTKVTRWRFDSDLAKYLFSFAGMDGSLARQSSVVTVPKEGWTVMTPDEAKAAAKKAAQMQQQMMEQQQAQMAGH